MVIVETPSGPLGFYRRTGGGGPAEGWASRGKWVPFHGLAETLTYEQLNSGNRLLRGWWVIKPMGGRTAAQGSQAISEFIGRELGEGVGALRGGRPILSIPQREAAVINDWLRFNRVPVGGGWSVGDNVTSPFRVIVRHTLMSYAGLAGRVVAG